jgi:hypothetical protein
MPRDKFTNDGPGALKFAHLAGLSFRASKADEDDDDYEKKLRKAVDGEDEDDDDRSQHAVRPRRAGAALDRAGVVPLRPRHPELMRSFGATCDETGSS